MFSTTSIQCAITTDSLCAFAELTGIQLPPKMRKRGRPKGAEKTVIGLTRKKRKSSGSKPLPFLKKHPADKEKGTHVHTLWYSV